MPQTLIFAATTLAVTAMLCVAASRAWRDWLAFKRLELARQNPSDDEPDVGVKIELAGVRERLRQLEAIASGVEL